MGAGYCCSSQSREPPPRNLNMSNKVHFRINGHVNKKNCRFLRAEYRKNIPERLVLPSCNSLRDVTSSRFCGPCSLRMIMIIRLQLVNSIYILMCKDIYCHSWWMRGRRTRGSNMMDMLLIQPIFHVDLFCVLVTYLGHPGQKI